MSEINVSREEILAAVASNSTETSVESIDRIGTGSPGGETKRTLTVHVPLNAQITRIKGYLRNAAWPDGCDLGSADWREADLSKYHEPIGWAYAGHVQRGTTPTSQWVCATFVNWSDCNARYGRLQVFYKFPDVSREKLVVSEVDPKLQGPIHRA